ncbi:hypothetical protein Rhopal_000275-T1 [Rhodotorula paludigena]|uniref:HMG box domain-containing protein n=1 Tax=Rhodotorula paludigena TaxID=86838 RepID=A0AAV5GCG7_9BASI|nr:hypothetical protein Rhopal_000275-T1 [Rhodotorula paludigena]
MASTSGLKGKEKEASGDNLRKRALAAVGRVALVYKELGRCQATARDLLLAYAAELRTEGADDAIADLEEMFGLVNGQPSLTEQSPVEPKDKEDKVPKRRALSGFTMFLASLREKNEGGGQAKWASMDADAKKEWNDKAATAKASAAQAADNRTGGGRRCKKVGEGREGREAVTGEDDEMNLEEEFLASE